MDIAQRQVSNLFGDMIVVVEGISASGKSTWCAQHGGGHLVPETGSVPFSPDPDNDPKASALFWADQNARRWRGALDFERQTGLAICDTDPLKLHYDWCLWQIGQAPEERWLAALQTTRGYLADQRLGFADRYFVKEIDPLEARRQKEADTTRARRNFDLHVRLQPPLIVWYQTLSLALEDRVQFTFPEEGPPRAEGVPSNSRYDLGLFDTIVGALPELGSFRSP